MDPLVVDQRRQMSSVDSATAERLITTSERLFDYTGELRGSIIRDEPTQDVFGSKVPHLLEMRPAVNSMPPASGGSNNDDNPFIVDLRTTTTTTENGEQLYNSKGKM